MKRPSVSTVKYWRVVYDSEYVTVQAGTSHFSDDYWMVKDNKANKKRYFYGESAWSDAAREAGDLDMGAWAL
jgi:hypothetical protein